MTPAPSYPLNADVGGPWSPSGQRSLMPTPTSNPASNALRAQIVAEAVVSAYIHEISPSQRRDAPGLAAQH